MFPPEGDVIIAKILFLVFAALLLFMAKLNGPLLLKSLSFVPSTLDQIVSFVS